jgi:hypothetical protein
VLDSDCSASGDYVRLPEMKEREDPPWLSAEGHVLKAIRRTHEAIELWDFGEPPIAAYAPAPTLRGAHKTGDVVPAHDAGKQSSSPDDRPCLAEISYITEPVRCGEALVIRATAEASFVGRVRSHGGGIDRSGAPACPD